MVNILLTLLMPFVPVWMYGEFLNVAKETNFPGASCEAGEICQELPQVLGEEKKAEGVTEEKKDTKFETKNLFPIDKVFASGFVPMCKTNCQDIKLWAGSSVAIDADSGTILHYDNGRKRTQIASLTKIMTAILVMENIKDLNQEVELTKESLNIVGTTVGCPTSVFCNANRMYVGEKVRAVDLLKATLMNSANDAATALAVQVSGSAKDFVKLMNEKAKGLGLKDTQFCTPSGLEIDGKEDQCYSSAYDIARIAAYSLRYDMIWDIMKIQEGRFYSTDGKYMHELKNTDLLLDTLPNCIGGKTGFTPLAGKSLLLGATDASGKHKVIAVVLNDENRWENMKTLTSWVFENYRWQ